MWEQLQANAGQEIGNKGCEHGPHGGKRAEGLNVGLRSGKQPHFALFWALLTVSSRGHCCVASGGFRTRQASSLFGWCGPTTRLEDACGKMAA